MAKAENLISILKAVNKNDKLLVHKIYHSIIAEARNKNQHVLAGQIEEILNNDSNPTRSLNGFRDHRVDNFLLKRIPRKVLDDIILTDSNTESIKEVIKENKRRDLLASFNLSPRNKVLLIGPPGNGKTTLAEVMASELSLPLYVIRYDGIIGSFLGETAARLRSLFDYIKTTECILFFDEFETIGKERGDANETGEIKRLVSTLLLQIDDLPNYVITICASNHPELLDRAVWRRFQIKIELGNPNNHDIRNYLKYFSNNSDLDLLKNYKTLPQKLAGMNFSEIEEFCLDIQRKYILSQPHEDLKAIIRKKVANLSSIARGQHESKPPPNISRTK